MRKPLTLILGTVVALLCVAATVNSIKLFTDKPNSIPVGSDFFVLQRNTDFINASVSQVKGDWFNNPVFSGNGGIQGVWTAVTFVGDGSQLTGINVSATNTSFPVITNKVLITTNVTIEVPGGFTNLNLTPKSLMWSDVNDAEASIPNASGFLTNNGTGGIGWSTVLEVTELDAQNAYLTNIFTFITNAPLLSTDGDGKLQAGNFLVATNNDTAISLAGSNNIIVLSNNVNSEISGALVSETNVLSGNGASVTNLTIRYNTNAIPTSGALTFGQAYFTNLQASVTLPAFTLNNAFYESLVIVATNSTGSDTTFTFPSGVKVALANGGGTTLTVTNKSRATIVIEHYGNLITNAWANYF